LVSTCSVRFCGRAAAVINGLPGLPTYAKYFWQWISFTPGYEMSCPGKMVGKWLLDIHFPTWVQTYLPGFKLTVLGMLGGENESSGLWQPTNVKKIKWFPKGTVLYSQSYGGKIKKNWQDLLEIFDEKMRYFIKTPFLWSDDLSTHTYVTVRKMSILFSDGRTNCSKIKSTPDPITDPLRNPLTKKLSRSELNWNVTLAENVETSLPPFSQKKSSFFLIFFLYPGGIRSHDPWLQSPRRQVETIH
jgi:hypothetical protein